MKTNTHGGKRPNAGRKAGGESKRTKKTVSLKLKFSTIDELGRLSEVYNRPKALIVEEAIDNFEKKTK
jgi:hypothetical protein